MRRKARTGVTAIVALACGALLLTACVDHEASAQKFCGRVKDRLTQSIDEQGVPATLPPREWEELEREPLNDALKDLEQRFNKAMRFSEDGTKAIRDAARDVDGSYLDISALVADKDSRARELRERRAELEENLAKLRRECAEATAGT